MGVLRSFRRIRVLLLHRKLFWKRLSNVVFVWAGVFMFSAMILVDKIATFRSPSMDAWVQIPTGQNLGKIFIYSAYWETGKNLIRLIGVGPRVTDDLMVTCTLNLTNSSTQTIRVQGMIRIINEHHWQEYSALFILCRPLLHNHSSPNSVSISVGMGDSRGIPVAPIRDNPDPPIRDKVLKSPASIPDEAQEPQLEVCIRPFEGYYNHTLQVIEFMEMYLILGASHFTLYLGNGTASDDTQCIIQSYAEEGLATVLPWSRDNLARENGHLAGTNDCLYRSRSEGKRWVAFVDFDEFLFPQMARHSTLVDLLQEVFASHPSTCSVVFRNVFHSLQWADDPRSQGLKYPLVSPRKARREQTASPSGIRSKYVLDTRRVEEAGVHSVWECQWGFEELTLDEQLGVSHHYRDCNCAQSNWTTESAAQRFEKELFQSVAKRIKVLRKQCPGVKVDQRENAG